MWQVIAVAIGSSIYFYKNLKPFFKYSFPSMQIDPLEKEMWRKVGIVCQSAASYSKTIKNFDIFTLCWNTNRTVTVWKVG